MAQILIRLLDDPTEQRQRLAALRWQAPPAGKGLDVSS
jgi:hypothetical protein